MAKRRLSAKSLRFLFARGVLKGKGKGKDRKVTYNKNAGKSRSERIAAGRKIANTPEVARKALKGSGLRVGQYKHSRGGKDPLTATGPRAAYKGDTRFLVRTARSEGKLKPRSTPRPASSRNVPSKAERDGTRAGRIAAGREKLARLDRIGNRSLMSGDRKESAAASSLNMVQGIKARSPRNISMREANREYRNMFGGKRKRTKVNVPKKRVKEIYAAFGREAPKGR